MSRGTQAMATLEQSVKVKIDVDTTELDHAIAKINQATAIDIRITALDRAIHVAEIRHVGNIVEQAAEFEKYLRGEKDA